MDDEMASLEKNNTWNVISKTEVKRGHQILDGKWVYKLKRGAQNEIIRHKARWVVKGFRQQYGIDYDQTFASVVKPMAYRVLFALAAHYDMEIDQLDVKTAFLHGDVDGDVYVNLPNGYGGENDNAGQVCKLNKALYGLKQSPRLWSEKLSAYLADGLELHPLHADSSVFISEEGLDGPIVVKAELKKEFEMTESPLTHYLGIKVERDRVKRTIKLSQPGYIDKILSRFHTTTAKHSRVPMKEGVTLIPEDAESTEKARSEYSAMIGSIMFLMVQTRPDIAQATSTLARFAKNPGRTHEEAAKVVLRYLQGSRDRGITYGGGAEDPLRPVGYSDADWAGNRSGRRSTSAYVFMLNGGTITWMSKLQPTVALSSTESEYQALTQAAKEATWLRLLLTELSIEIQGSDINVESGKKCFQDIIMDLRGDNQSAIALSHNPVLHTRTKHIDIQHHYIRDEVLGERIKLTYVPTEEMVADGLTKPLGPVKFEEFLKQLRMLGSRRNLISLV